MDILIIDTEKYSTDEIENIVKDWEEKTGNTVLMIPKDIGIIRNLTVGQIISIRDWLNEIIEANLPQEGETIE